MEKRLQELRREFEKGQQQLDLLDRQRQELRDTLLRISGAIRVLEELIPTGTSDRADLAAYEVGT